MRCLRRILKVSLNDAKYQRISNEKVRKDFYNIKNVES